VVEEVSVLLFFTMRFLATPSDVFEGITVSGGANFFEKIHKELGAAFVAMWRADLNMLLDFQYIVLEATGNLGNLDGRIVRLKGPVSGVLVKGIKKTSRFLTKFLKEYVGTRSGWHCFYQALIDSIITDSEVEQGSLEVKLLDTMLGVLPG
jgi:hypothetical protein